MKSFSNTAAKVAMGFIDGDRRPNLAAIQCVELSHNGVAKYRIVAGMSNFRATRIDTRRLARVS